jgi:N-acetylglucosaminyldiphosphoundecaprenol N-acetyl-beta-D-mannosaminyltransferase
VSSGLDLLARDCFSGELGDAAEAVVTRALSGEGGYACLANVHVAVTTERDDRVRNALASSWRVFPDGTPIAWLRRRGGATCARRIPGPDLFAGTLDAGRAVGLRHYLFGSTPSVLAALERRMGERFPGVEIAGTLAPPPGEERSPACLEAVHAAEPHVVWVALGAPKQELWMADHAAALAPALLVGVGAAFDFHAGVKARAPRWMQNAGLEWLHRLATEPRRLGWRYLSTNTLFALWVLRGGLRRA